MTKIENLPPHLQKVDIESFEVCRRKQGKGFHYFYVNKEKSLAGPKLEKLKNIGVPATWTEVKLSTNPKAYIQAVGYDGSGKLQYLYHPDFTEYRNLKKFNELLEFGESLPKIRRKVKRDLKQEEWNEKKLMALMVRILDKYHLRIGSRVYSRQNNSFGLTTLRKKHIKEVESKICFEYTGKGSVERRVELDDPYLLSLIREIAEYPGWELFSINQGNKKIKATSGEINQYIRDISQSDYTARTFRTWAGTVLAVKNAPKARKIVEKNPRREMSAVLAELVAQKLGNTPAICRAYYIHPGVFEQAVKPDFIAVPTNKKYLTCSIYRKYECRTLELLSNTDILEFNGN